MKVNWKSIITGILLQSRYRFPYTYIVTAYSSKRLLVNGCSLKNLSWLSLYQRNPRWLVPVFPFHLWLPEVHSETDTCGSVLLAGVLLKVGSYGLMRFTLTLFPVGYSYWSCFIFVVSLFGSYLGSINCLTIYDIKQIIAYSSITHMNLAVADLFTLNIYGLLLSMKRLSI